MDAPSDERSIGLYDQCTMVSSIVDAKLFVPIISYSDAALAEAAFTRMAICTPGNLSSSYLETRTGRHGQIVGLYRQPSVLAGEAVEHMSGIGEGFAHCSTYLF